MSNLDNHAKKELELAGFYDKDAMYGELLPNAVLELLEVFSNQGHSGMSASVTIGLFKKLAMFEPLTPITGNNDEWAEIEMDNGMLQNKRDCRIFKHLDTGECTFNNAITWRTQNDTTWHGSAETKDGLKVHSSLVIKDFPFVPKEFVIDVIETEVAKDDWEFTIADDSQLEEVWKYYKKPE